MDSLPPTDIGLAPLEVRTDAAYVRGFPMHVAIVVRADRPGVAFPTLPSVDWWALRGAVGIGLGDVGDANGANVANTLAVSAQCFEDDADPVYSLRDGESRRMLVDLSEWLEVKLPPSDGSPATTRREPLRLWYGSSSVQTPVAVGALLVREPTAEEGALLEALAAERTAAGTWGAWASSPGLASSPIAEARGVSPAVWFASVTRQVMFARARLSDVDLTLVDTLSAFYAPEREVFRVEILGALGRTDEAQAARVVSLQRNPEMRHRFDAMDEGVGWLRWRAR